MTHSITLIQRQGEELHIGSFDVEKEIELTTEVDGKTHVFGLNENQVKSIIKHLSDQLKYIEQ